MIRQQGRDAVGGALIALFGTAMVLWAMNSLPMGTLRRMGPGLFPAGVGGLIALTGAAMLMQALWPRVRDAAAARVPGPAVNLRALVFVSAALLAFGLLAGPFGMIPAIVALVGLCALSDRDSRPMATLALMICLPAAVYLIFRLGLGLPMAMIRWPF